MIKQTLFTVVLLITLGVFVWSVFRLRAFFKLTKPAYPIKNISARITRTLNVAFGQSKIFRKPVIGFMHALVFWGFLVITLGSIEMVFDGLVGSDRSFAFMGIFYDVIMASGDVFAFIILVFIILFIIRRSFMNISRFKGVEVTPKTNLDAQLSLYFIGFLMLSLLVFNLGYISNHSNEVLGVYPVSSKIIQWTSMDFGALQESGWWVHILLIFVFANYLPYSKHFHVFLSIPNVFLSNLEPLTKYPNLESITREVKLMLDPEAAYDESEEVTRFGVKDIEDVTWRNYMDSLACTQCGRCTDVCPANITGKRLSPRKIFVDLRHRMNEKGTLILKGEDDTKSLIRDYISEEEIWACTSCNACAQECPIEISHPNLIMDMRRYLVMEEASAPAGLNAMFANIENNGAPWQYSPEDRMKWAE
ncbi:(Fe-S)-binding protein [Ancylomarina euxinus]|uniref:(Fe-S)-binding protein n=1 Tax=Ancylomarina euxinus TaxID=2283627 RepID=A0A425XX92_9BACT|nr:(Fe-S)-binding protein [Ancylomarina euxinus]MCZ4696159.1 (Fe-S)-binding protein [Ancylomarina euxinus]MUP16568.1 4Fe-4S dicluster domain-containing protein [Ancylomarina euxinus]RRG19273.1 (Fe-S)-binding protein [Ancylomarina euxinus]